ncbi:MAG: hypothetical protein Q8R25_04395 [bacterium]|nr:hypothetical protein [bacterium]
MQRFEEWVRQFGYRAPTREDVVGGAEFMMVDVERFLGSHPEWGICPATCGCTLIRLDDEPIRPSDLNPAVVYYHCVMPSWAKQCFISLDNFMASGHRVGCHVNDVRYVMKI